MVLPEPEPPSTAAWRFRTFLLSVIDLAPGRSSRPATMLEPPPFSSRITDSGSSSSSSPISGSVGTAGCRQLVAVERHGCGRRSPFVPLAAASASAAADFGSARPSRSRRRSWMMAGRLDSSLALPSQPAKPGSWRWWVWNSRTIIMRSHSGIGTRIWRPPASRNLRNACAVWFLRLGGKSDARSMKHCLAPMLGSTRSNWRLRPPPCVGLLQMKTRPSVVRPPLCFSVKSMAERSSASSRRSMLSRMVPAHSSLARPSAPARTSSSSRSSDGISASEAFWKRSQASR